MAEDKLTERLNQERITTRLQKQEIQKLESQNSRLQLKLKDLKEQLKKRELEIEEEEREIQRREAQVKEDYEAIKASLYGNLNEVENTEEIEKAKEIEKAREAKEMEMLKELERLRDEKILYLHESKKLEEKVISQHKLLIEKNNTISNLNMIIKVQATRIEGFMTENAHHLEQNLKLNRLLEASTKKIAPEQNTSHNIQKSINSLLTKPQPTSYSLPARTHTLFDSIDSSSPPKQIKRCIDDVVVVSRESSPKSNQRLTTYSSSPEQGRDATKERSAVAVASPELGDSPNSYNNIETEENDAVIFDVSFSPPEPSSPKITERPLVYLDENTFDDSQPRSGSISPFDKVESHQTISPLETISEENDDQDDYKKYASPSSIQRRIAELDNNLQRRSSQENTSNPVIIERRSSFTDENQVSYGLKKDTVAKTYPKAPLGNVTNMQINTTGQPSKENKTNRKTLAPKEDHAHCKEATCIACEKFYGKDPLQDVDETNNQVTPRNRIQLHSRHRARATTPPGFWDLGFPYTLSP